MRNKLIRVINIAINDCQENGKNPFRSYYGFTHQSLSGIQVYKMTVPQMLKELRTLNKK